jgi:hypothetical protein
VTTVETTKEREHKMATATPHVKVCQATKTVSSEKKGVEVKRLQKADAPIFHLEKLGLRSGIGDLAERWHHYLYGTEKER